MTDPRPDAHPANAPGRFYIDMSCVNCGLCPALAPDTFREADDATHSFVHRQPQAPEEEAVAEDAASQCPTNSIKADGHVYSKQNAQAQTA